MGKKRAPSAPAAAEPVPTYDCCELLTKVLQYAAETDRKVVGLQVAHVFSKVTGAHSWSPTVYILPNRGRGKAMVKGMTAIVTHCPFCGRQQPGRPSDG